LFFISIFLFFESIFRLFKNEKIEGESIFIIAIFGLIINVMGVIYFHQKHDHDHNFDENIYAIYIHMIVDSIGSIFIIISSLMIKFFDLYFFDTISSILVSIIIFISSFILIKKSFFILLLSHNFQKFDNIFHIENTYIVYKYFWMLNNNILIGINANFLIKEI
jgi:cation diffusion facilitator family transporter